MKRISIIISFLGINAFLFAQSHVDALRYSQHNIGGTARSVAMGGAFGALGGDFSTLSSNPAGLGVYRGSEFTFTPEFYFNNITSRYLGTETSEGKFNFNLSNLGYVANFSDFNGVLKALNFGIGYNRIANFHRNTITKGTNYNTTFADYMVEDANEYGLSTFTSEIFWEAYVIDDDTTYGGYKINDSQDGFLYDDGTFRPTEQYVINNEKGRINEWTLSVGLNLSDILYFGTTIGIQPVRYEFDKSWREFDAENTGHQYFDYKESLEVIGTGYTAKFGLIYRPISLLRIGAAAHLPVSYNLREEYKTSMTSIFVNRIITPVDEYGDEIDYLESNYKVVSPAKLMGSVALVLGKIWLISSDVEYINYSSMRMSSNDFDLSAENDNIRAIYSNAINVKLGSELRFDNTYLRGGFGYYESPFNDTEENSDAFRLSYSGGIGFRDEKFFFDIAYQYVNYDERQFLYGVNINNTDYFSVANNDSKAHRVMTTIGFRF